MLRKSSLLLAAAAVLALAMPASAALDGGTVVFVEGKDPNVSSYVLNRVAIRYDDLDINDNAGANELLNRIQQAAVQVCGTRGLNNYALTQKRQVCRTKAVAQAVARVGAPQLTRLAAEAKK